MIEKKYNLMKELFADASVVRDMLIHYGATPEASELGEVLECFWTTSSEAIVELLTSFDAINATCVKKFSSEELSFFNEVRSGAKSLLNSR
jgi:hypothetical protein